MSRLVAGAIKLSDDIKVASVLLASAAILNGGIVAARQPDAQRPSGVVRIDGRAVADERGPFNALGATLFWGAWGYKFDRARLERNLEALRTAGVDYIRVLGSVGGESWTDRETDPRWEDYDAVIAGLTDFAFDRYGIRIQWTIFGGAPFTPPGEARSALVDRFIKMAKGREHKIFAIEIANESWQNGFEGAAGIAEIRALAKRVNDATPILVALSSPRGGGECELYAGAGADIATFHYDRSFDEDGPIRPISRPWEYPQAFDAKCRGQLPAVVFNNEPIGPQSSVQADDDTGRIAAAYAMTFVAGNGAYVLHASPGIRGGGAADVALKRPANFYNLPAFASIATALKAARTYLPPGLPNWERRQADHPRAPLGGSDRLYAAVSGSQFIAVLAGLSAPVTLRAAQNGSIEVRDAASGRVVQRVDVTVGSPFTTPPDDPIVLIGRSGP